MIRYRLDVDAPRGLHTHQFRVTLTVPAPGAEQRLSLPVWIPGSYLVREFARHLSGLQVRQKRPSSTGWSTSSSYPAACQPPSAGASAVATSQPRGSGPSSSRCGSASRPTTRRNRLVPLKLSLIHI